MKITQRAMRININRLTSVLTPECFEFETSRSNRHLRSVVGSDDMNNNHDGTMVCCWFPEQKANQLRKQ